ncbi:hypothetical protein FJZ26_04640, partial [Candidatus Parvarchaeota archaeon]|nr:hypothetical protein [Candidatus Parvarchaeota archaeon]
MAKLWEKKSWQSAPMLVLLLALFLTPSQVFSQVVNPNLCPIPQFNSYLMAFVSTETSTVDAYSFYDNGSARVPLAGEPIYVIKRNPNDNSITSICKDKSDAQGKISTTFDPNAANCTQFTFLHCIDSTSDWLLRDCISNESVRRIDPSYVVQISNPPYALFQRIPSCSGAAYTLPLPKNYSSAVAETQYCNPNKASAKEALCWPILLIFGLLVGAMFAIGRNPLHSFDLSAPRFDRGRQYQMRNMNVSFQVTPILGIAFEAAGLQTSDGKGDKKTDKMEDAGFSVGNVFSGIGTRLLNAVMANTLGIKPEKREDVKDENGNVVGTKDKKGNVFGLDGKQVGTVDKKGDVKNLKGELVGGLGTANIFSGAGAFKGKSFADAVSETSQSR